MKVDSRKLTLKASGKINLYLNVKKGYRVDGYHEIKSIMQSISLSDELHFEVFESGHSYSDKEYSKNGIFITTNNIDIPLDEKNLVHKAALIILDNFNLVGRYNIKINIEKSIPVCSGLAGGSTNAAATLVALNKLFNLDISYSQLLKLASDVGSDVPFCIDGGTALVEGRGEKISKLPDLPFYWVVLASNGRKFLTGEVYKKFDLVGKEKKQIHTSLVASILEGKFNCFFKNLGNDLEEVVTREDEIVILIKQKALMLGAFFAQMTGSGPTVFAFCPDLKIAKRVYEGLASLANEVFLSHTVPRSLNFI